ncbi:MAG: hypothetical protein D6820_18370 [Lentisphaerae bacterium]|nr:MAG: hypothetical protein D6820_18370 [Lentisphaerota bacterium]
MNDSEFRMPKEEDRSEQSEPEESECIINKNIKKNRTATFSYLMIMRSLNEELDASVKQLKVQHTSRAHRRRRWWNIWQRIKRKRNQEEDDSTNTD